MLMCSAPGLPLFGQVPGDDDFRFFIPPGGFRALTVPEALVFPEGASFRLSEAFSEEPLYCRKNTVYRLWRDTPGNDILFGENAFLLSVCGDRLS